ncbi:MAG: L,D-transpeptidase family protein, partial [Sphingosinicella sp.]
MLRTYRSAALALLLASPSLPAAMESAAFAQTEPQAPPQQQTPVPAPTVPGTVQPGVPGMVQPLPQPVVAMWTVAAAEELIRYIENIGREGLDPANYRTERLHAAFASGDPAVLTREANPLFLQLSADLSGGQVRGNGRVGWHMSYAGIDGNTQQLLMARAAQGEVTAVLDSLLPTHSQYAGLRQTLATIGETDPALRELIRTNMERWRWMPRDLGARHVIVNVPAFTAALVENGRVAARHRVVVGARRTPTPQLNARITAVTMNPWWHVPQSIIPELGGRFGGYDVRRLENGQLMVRQPQGPRNALGRV